MGFTWSSSGIGEKIFASETQELKTNIDVLYNDLSLSAWSWSNIPATSGTFIESVDIDEIRDAVDFAHDNNYCSGHDATNLTGYQTGYELSYFSEVQASVLTGEDSGIYNSVQTGERYSENLSACGGNNSTVNGSNLVGELNGWNIVDLQTNEVPGCLSQNSIHA